MYRDLIAWNILVDTARPPSPGDQSRQDYRRGGGYDKQGEVGAGSSRPEFVSFNPYQRIEYFLINFFSVVAMVEAVDLMMVIVVVPAMLLMLINNK
jgi:hypothetical protein